MKQAFAIGKVINGRMTVITKDGDGYSRPTRKPVPTTEPTQKIYDAPVAVYSPYFIQHWVRDEEEVYQPPRIARVIQSRKPPRLSILDYIKELYW